MNTSAATNRMNANGTTYETPWAYSKHAKFGEFGRACLAGVLLSLPVLLAGGWAIHAERADKQATLDALAARQGAHDRLLAAAPAPVLPVTETAHGRDVFITACAACHKPDGTGVAGLGKDLTTSWFVASADDQALRSFIAVGRSTADPLNTTRVEMPPRGGHPDLTPDDLTSLVTFLRGLQDPRRMPDLPAPVLATAPVTEADKAAALAAAGGDAELAEYIAHGAKVFASTCIACHGKDARGLPNLGKDLVASTFVRGLDDDGLLAFIKRGRNPGDPANTTKLDMPARGGNPALTDDDLLDVIAFVRSLQKQASAAH
jgi:disulfide bond formation protein DsbB